MSTFCRTIKVPTAEHWADTGTSASATGSSAAQLIIQPPADLVQVHPHIAAVAPATAIVSTDNKKFRLVTAAVLIILLLGVVSAVAQPSTHHDQESIAMSKSPAPNVAASVPASGTSAPPLAVAPESANVVAGAGVAAADTTAASIPALDPAAVATPNNTKLPAPPSVETTSGAVPAAAKPESALTPANAVSLGLAAGGCVIGAAVGIAALRRKSPVRRKSTKQPGEATLLDEPPQTAPGIRNETTGCPKPACDDAHPSTAPMAPSSQLIRHGAADIAYISPEDWMAALARHYGVITRPNPLHAVVSLAGGRDTNEDYACHFNISDDEGQTLDCFLVADGCGGYCHGKEASCLAVRAASEELIRATALPPDDRLGRVFRAASQALIKAGRRYDENSLRTTLIVVIATPTRYITGHIGDGRVIVHRHDGQWESLIEPHQLEEAQNYLTASLGPSQEGMPSFSRHLRSPGDRLYLGSDGVFDMYDEPTEFWSWFEQDSVASTPLTSMTAFLEACAKNERFTDNLTVCYLATPLRRMAAAVAAEPWTAALHPAL